MPVTVPTSDQVTQRTRPAPGAGAPVTGDRDELGSVVVPARNEGRTIGATLAALRSQDYRTLQIIVVDGGSTDRTVDVVHQHAREDPRVELVPNPRQAIP